MNLQSVPLFGASSLSKVISIYEVWDARGVPWGKYKIKVLQRSHDYLALPNLAVRNASGTVDGVAGLGQTEIDALQDVLSRMNEALSSRPSWRPEDFEWSDPRDF